jgi:hypothetical protein
MILDNNLFVLDRSDFVVVDVVASQPLVTRVTQRLFSWSTRSFERLPICLSSSPPTYFFRCATKDWLMPTKVATLQVKMLLTSCTQSLVLLFVRQWGIWLQKILQIAPHVPWNQG